MPYISEKNRKNLDDAIENLINSIKENGPYFVNAHMTKGRALSNEELTTVLGDINYCFSRVLGDMMGTTSYSKIAMITGVLENIKQEFYRRVAEPYEHNKILENGDIKEYKRLK
jgi:hypothetical protein